MTEPTHRTSWRLFERFEAGRSRFWAIRRVDELIELWYGQKRPRGTVLARFGDHEVMVTLVEKKRLDGYLEAAPLPSSEGPSEEEVRRARARARQQRVAVEGLGPRPLDQLVAAVVRSDVDAVRREQLGIADAR